MRADKNRNTATAAQEKQRTPPIEPAISIDEYQIDFVGAQTTLPSMAELLLLGLTRPVAVSASVMSNSSVPISIFRIHEIRDWQQNQPDCHSFAKHDVGFWRDALWQMHCRQILTRPPELLIEHRVTGDKFYQWLEATWRWQQFPLAIVLYAVGGWGFVFWGVCLRVAVSLTGHWCVVHVAHTRGERPYALENIAIDGRNVRGLGLVTFGECWHNNHHAFPRSARMGHSADEIDPGWLVIRALMIMGLACNVTVPDPSRRCGALRIERPMYL